MKVLALLIVASGAGLLLAGCAAPVDPPSEPSVPPPEPRTMPGEVKGRVQTRWLAPYVSVTARSFGGKGTTTVQWFTPDGELARELAGPNVDVHPGYVYEYGEGKGTIHAVNCGWKIALPRCFGANPFSRKTVFPCKAVWKDEARKFAQVEVVGSDGKVRFRVAWKSTWTTSPRRGTGGSI